MKNERVKVYLYTRVSTVMQIDGYSLEAQKSKMKAFCEYNDYEIAGEYEDAGKPGKSIEGRASFTQMLNDIKSGKDGVSFVLVFKLSRFGRNAADVLSTLQIWAQTVLPDTWRITVFTNFLARTERIPCSSPVMSET